MNVSEVRERAFSMPIGSPSYPVGPYRFTGREFLRIAYTTHPELLERLVPEPLEVAEAEVTLEFVSMPDSVGFGSYMGCAQVIPVRFRGELGRYTVSMFLDSHPPIVGGRELWGFPQKLGAPKLSVERDTLVGTLHAGPLLLASGSMGYKHRVLPARGRDLLAEPGFVLKIIPHVDGSARICELVRYRTSDSVLKGAWTGPAALSLHPHALAPLASLPVVAVTSAIHFIADYTLELGEVVHDYLENSDEN